MNLDYLKNIPKMYYINLERSKERKERMEKLLSEYNIVYERVEAVDGLTLDTWDPRVTRFETACCLSHLKAVEQFYNSGESEAIICEDDLSFEFYPLWNKSLREVINDAPKDLDVLMLSYIISPENYSSLQFKYNQYDRLKHWSTLCYYLKREGAERLLKKHSLTNPNFHNIVHPVADTIVYLPLKTYVYFFSLFIYPDNNDSTIHNEHLELHMISKQIAKYILLNYIID